MSWQLNVRVARQRPGDPSVHYDVFTLEVDPDEYVLDVIERIWGQHDRSLMFRHACHHASCGTCGMRVNGAEKLACVTSIRDVTTDGGTLTVEPLRNLPLVGDLVVDPAPMFAALAAIGMPIMRSVEAYGEPGAYNRFEDCIECGLCISACPLMATSSAYLGPAALAAAERVVEERRSADLPSVLDLVDSEEGCWRCHTAFECSEVCPMNVNPAGRIMALRRALMIERIKSLFWRGKTKRPAPTTPTPIAPAASKPH
ncbi:MAG: 2Fe-2S iron-sulfur cluster-binding protein [Anaerolineae bacterium]